LSRLPLPEPETLSPYLHTAYESAEEDSSGRNVVRAFGHAPEMMETYLTQFYYPWHTSSAPGARLSPRLKELVRLRIATLNGCVTCKAARLAADTVAEVEALGIDDYAGSEDYSPSEKAAVWFAEMLAVDHHSITDQHIAELREHYDDGEIVELMMMAGQYIGFGRMLAVLQLEVASCPLPAMRT